MQEVALINLIDYLAFISLLHLLVLLIKCDVTVFMEMFKISECSLSKDEIRVYERCESVL